MRILLFPLILIFSLSMALTGCSEPGPAEQAGENIDEAMEDARESLEELGEEPGPAERAGETVDDAVDEAADSYEELREE